MSRVRPWVVKVNRHWKDTELKWSQVDYESFPGLGFWVTLGSVVPLLHWCVDGPSPGDRSGPNLCFLFYSWYIDGHPHGPDLVFVKIGHTNIGGNLTFFGLILNWQVAQLTCSLCDKCSHGALVFWHGLPSSVGIITTSQWETYPYLITKVVEKNKCIAFIKDRRNLLYPCQPCSVSESYSREQLHFIKTLKVPLWRMTVSKACFWWWQKLWSAFVSVGRNSGGKNKCLGRACGT